MAYTLSAQKRTTKGQYVRAEGLVPAVIYGAAGDSVSLSLSLKDFTKLYKAAGESSLIDLTIDGKDGGKVLVQDVQFDPTNDRPMHVDLRRIDMKKEMTARVELRIVGESPAVKEAGGTLVRNVHEVEVKCLPSNLVSHIDVDVSVLKTFDDVIKIKNLVVPAGITITRPNAEDLVIKAAPALTEEEIKAMEEEAKSADVTKIELATKKKEEDEEAAEGAEGEKKADDKKEEKK